MFDTIGQYTERKCGSPAAGFRFRRAIGHYARKRRHLTDPPAIRFAVNLDPEHGYHRGRLSLKNRLPGIPVPGSVMDDEAGRQERIAVAAEIAALPSHFRLPSSYGLFRMASWGRSMPI
jgi:hypothetical protein